MHKIRHHFTNIFSSGFMRSLFLPLILVVSGFVAIVAVFVYFFFTKGMKESVVNSRMQNLMSVSKSIEKSLSDFDAISNGINSNPNFISSKSHEDANEGKSYSLSESQEIKKYLVGNSFFTYLTYYRVADPDTFYSSVGKLSTKSLWDAYLSFSDMTCNEFIDKIKNSTYHTTFNFHSDEKEEEYIVLINPIPLTNLSKNAFIVAFIDKGNIDSYMSSFLNDFPGQLVIKDGNGDVFYEYSNSKVKLDFSDRKNVVQKTVSNSYKWTFEVVYEKKVLFENIYLTEMMMAIVSVLVIIITVFVSMWVVSRKFMPINRLAVSMLEDDSKENSGVIKEHELLTSKFTSIMQEQKKVYYELFFSNLLADQYDKQLLDDAIDEYDIIFDGDCFCPVVIKADINKEDKNKVEEIKTLIQECVYADFESSYIHVQKSPFCFVVLLNGSKEQFEPVKITELMQLLYEQLYEKNRVSINIGIGSVCNDLLKIKQSSAAATSATFYSAQKEDVFYTWADDMVGKELPDEATRFITKMCTGIKQGKVELVTGYFESFAETELQYKAELKNYIVYNISLALLEYANGQDCENAVKLALDELAGENVDVDEIMNNLQKIAVNLAAERSDRDRKIEKKASEGQHELLNKIQAVINDKLCDSMLSLEILADECDVSPSYLSRYFKQRTGCTPMAYIENARMDITKKMLVTTELSLDEIIDRVGYIDKSNFIRKFKKREDCTPMAYRRTYSEHQIDL